MIALPAGVRVWLAGGATDIVAEATAEYFDDQDVFGQWLDESCIKERNAFEVQAKLYASWKAFAERQGDRPGSSKCCSDNLIRRGFKAGKERIGGTQYRIFRGLSLRFGPSAAGINHD